MTNQTILSDAELIIKGYNSVIVDAQDEYEEIKNEVLLQLEDLGDDEFQTYREFELRLEAYENGAFDPDIEKILGIGSRKAGTLNPFSDQAGINREDSRKEKARRRNLVRTDTKARGKAVAGQKKPGLQAIDPTQFKGRRAGGEAQGATRRARYNKDEAKNIEGDEIDVKTGEKRKTYGGGDVSERDTIAGAAARLLVGGRKKLGAAKRKLDQRERIGGKIEEASGKVKEKVSAGVEAAKAGAEETGRRGKQVTKITTTAAKDVKDVALTGKVQPTKVGGPRSSRPYVSPIQPKSTPAGTDKAPSAPQQGPYSSTGKYIGNVNKSFTARLRKSMGYRPRHRY